MVAALPPLDRIPSAICFAHSNSALSVTIRTTRLFIRSVQPEDLDNYAKLFGDEIVMQKFATGKTKTRDEIDKRIQGWVKRWLSGDPFSGMTVFNKDTQEFMGHIVLGHGDGDGESEMAYLFHQKYWNQGYGKEAVNALVKDYASALVKRGYTLNDIPLQMISATTRIDNVASTKILDKLGDRLPGAEEKHGSLRYHYKILVRAIDRNVTPEQKTA